MSDELAKLEAQLNALIDDQSKLETGVFHVRKKHREEHEKQKDIEFKRRREEILSNRDERTGPGPGEHNINYNHSTKRPIGGLIQPLSVHTSSRRTVGASTTRGQRRRNKQYDDGESIDYKAVSRAQNVIRTKPVGLAGFKRPKDPVVEAAGKALEAAAAAGRSLPGPSSFSVLSRACTMNPKSQSGAPRVGCAVFKSVRDGLTMQTSRGRGTTSCVLVLGGAGHSGTVSTGSTTAMTVNTVGSAVVFGVLGNRQVCVNVKDRCVLQGVRSGPTSASGTRFGVEIHAIPRLGKPVHVILRDVETGSYVSRAAGSLKDKVKDNDDYEEDFEEDEEKEEEQQEQNKEDTKQEQVQTEHGGVSLVCASTNRDDAEVFRVFNYAPESGDYDTNISIKATKRHTPSYGFGAPPPLPSKTPSPSASPPPPSTPKTPRQSNKHAASSSYKTPTSQTSAFGRSKRTKIPSGSNLEDEELLEWLKSGRMQRVILSTKTGCVLTAPSFGRHGAVHARDTFPGTGESVLSFCYIPPSSRAHPQTTNSIVNGDHHKNKNCGEFAMRNVRGHYVVMTKDGTLAVQREPDAETDIAFNVVVQRNSILLSVGNCPLHVEEKTRLVRMQQEVVNNDGGVSASLGTLFRVNVNVELGMSLGPNDKGVEHIKPRVIGGGRWGPRTPQTPDNMHVPSEGAPTPYSQRYSGSEDDDEWMGNSEDDEGDMYLDELPPPEMDIDRHVRPRVPGPAWSIPIQQQEQEMSSRRKRKMRSRERGTPGPGEYDAAGAMNKMRKKGEAGGTSFGRPSGYSGTATSSVLRRKRVQREREAASGGPGMYDTSLANGSKSVNAGTTSNSAATNRGGFARTERFHLEKPRRTVTKQTTTKSMKAEKDSINNDSMDIEEKEDVPKNVGKKNKQYDVGWHGGTKISRDRGEYDGRDHYNDSDNDNDNDEYYDEGKRQMYESKINDEASRDQRRQQRNVRKVERQKKKQIVRPRINLLDQVHSDDILDQEGAASALLAPRDLNISAVKPRVKGTTWGHKSVAKNFKNYHALKRARRRKQRESEIGPTDYESEKARKALIDSRVTGGPNFAQEERVKKATMKKIRKIRSKQVAMEQQRLQKLREKNPTLKEPDEILASQLHVDWAQKETNKPVFQYHEPEPLPSPAVRAQKARAREVQGSSRWLSTQLPAQWGENNKDDMQSDFGQQVGRESVTVKKKGSKRVEHFDARPKLGMDPLGPGHYEDAVRQQDANDPLARVADRGVLSFGKRTGRYDGIGPFGERPTIEIEKDREDPHKGLEGQMLDIESGVSRDRPNRKSAVAFTWRKSEKWDDVDDAENHQLNDGYGEAEELVLSPHDDHMRPRGDRGFNSFGKQLGRVPSKKEKEESMLWQKKQNEKEMRKENPDYYEEEELQLDPRHTPVEKRKDVGHAFSTKPRFEVATDKQMIQGGDSEQHFDDELLLSPKEHFFRNKLRGGVSMDKQTSRGLTNPNFSSDVTGEDDYADDIKRSPWRDAEYDVERGHEKLKGSKPKGGYAHDFSKQKPRFEENDAELGAGNFDDEVQLYLSPKEFDSRKKKSQQAMNWAKSKPRFSPAPERNNDDYYDDGSVLELRPTDEGTSNRTTSMKGSGGVAMSKSKPRWSPLPDRSGAAESATLNEGGATLLLDSHAAEKTLRTRGKISPAGWRKAAGRSEGPKSHAVDTSDLVYSPNPDFGRKGGSAGKVGNGNSQSGTTGWSNRKGRTPPRVADPLTDAMEKLILDPTCSETALRRQGGARNGTVSMHRPTHNPRQRNGVHEERSVDGDRLRISPNLAPLRVTINSGVTMGAQKTIPRGRPPRQPRKTAAEKKLSKTLQGINRRKKTSKPKIHVPKKPTSAAQKLMAVARKQYLQSESDKDMDALGGWE